MSPRPPIRALIFDAGHTLLELDYGALTGFLRGRGHAVERSAVTDAERRARARLDAELATASTRRRTGEGRYDRYLLAGLGIVDDAERQAVAEWRRRFNVPIGLCHQADGQASTALEAARAAGLVVGVISNSNGSVQLALERAGIAAHFDFVIDSTVVGVTKPDPRIFTLGLEAAGVPRVRRCTSAIRTSSMSSARGRPALERCCSIQAAWPTRVIASSPPVWVRPSSWRSTNRDGCVNGDKLGALGRLGRKRR
jgi:putative hydrolase of the HAD superfamily